ncbi:GTP pyrophosphokinase YjbM [Enterococcus sp. 3C8_DIV0646]|nr:GTP pyrophosphokinase YjbM [Enterococcus sp. 3C8_DIV0646]
MIEYPVQLIDGEKIILAEVQIRTLAMNFWATIEHSLNYKYPVSYTHLDVYKRQVQIRTLAMNFWATIEHSLNYKCLLYTSSPIKILE